MATSQIIVLCPALHYVDDYGSSAIAVEAESGFTGFEDLNGALGYNMKPSKRQPPATEQRIQAVIITSDQQYTRVKPFPKKVHKMTQEIGQCIKNNSLSQDLAMRVAGKCNFLTESLFGRVGRAPPKALYARANSTQHHLDKATTATLHAISDIIITIAGRDHTQDHQTRSLLHHVPRAYYIANGNRRRPGDEVPPDWRRQEFTKVENGWGAVIFIRGDKRKAAYFQGRLPNEILKQFSSNTALIYLIEAWVAILAPIIFEPRLGPFYVQCCDNEAARHALFKGVGKPQPLNCLISAHWTWRNRCGIRHRIERVPLRLTFRIPSVDSDCPTHTPTRHRQKMQKDFG